MQDFLPVYCTAYEYWEVGVWQLYKKCKIMDYYFCIMKRRIIHFCMNGVTSLLTRNNLLIILMDFYASQVIWSCLVEDSALFLRFFLEKLTRERQDVMIRLLRRLIRFIPRLPSQVLWWTVLTMQLYIESMNSSWDNNFHPHSQDMEGLKLIKLKFRLMNR